jgi:hypothetical protein
MVYLDAAWGDCVWEYELVNVQCCANFAHLSQECQRFSAVLRRIFTNWDLEKVFVLPSTNAGMVVIWQTSSLAYLAFVAGPRVPWTWTYKFYFIIHRHWKILNGSPCWHYVRLFVANESPILIIRFAKEGKRKRRRMRTAVLAAMQRVLYQFFQLSF